MVRIAVHCGGLMILLVPLGTPRRPSALFWSSRSTLVTQECLKANFAWVLESYWNPAGRHKIHKIWNSLPSVRRLFRHSFFVYARVPEGRQNEDPARARSWFGVVNNGFNSMLPVSPMKRTQGRCWVGFRQYLDVILPTFWTSWAAWGVSGFAFYSFSTVEKSIGSTIGPPGFLVALALERIIIKWSMYIYITYICIICNIYMC